MKTQASSKSIIQFSAGHCQGCAWWPVLLSSHKHSLSNFPKIYSGTGESCFAVNRQLNPYITGLGHLPRKL